MATRESTFVNMFVTLTLVTLVAALSLGFVHQWTKEPITQARLARQLRAIEVVVSGYDNDPVADSYRVLSVNGKDSLTFFPAKKNGRLIGTAIRSLSSKGYSGDVVVMVGLDTTGTILNISVVEHAETPGLGSKMTMPFFLDQFLNTNPGKVNLKVRKDGGTIDAISGATITSRAFSEAIQLAYDTYKLNGHGK